MERKILEKQSPKFLLALILPALVIFTGVIAPESVWAQGQMRERLLKDRGNPPAKREFEGAPERNPFFLPSGVSLLSKGKTTPEGKGNLEKENPAKSEVESRPIPPPAPLKVKVILISEAIRLAAIDQYIVGVGDSIKNEKVLEIKTDRVILGKGKQRRTLYLSQSPLPLTIEEK